MLRRRAAVAAALCAVLLATASVAGAAARKSYYDILQVSRTASDAQIKRAYRKLALQFHPDKVTGTPAEKEAAATKFADINVAYETLSNEETRNIYDRFGEDGLKQHLGRQAGDGGGPGDIFSHLFGGAFGGFGGDGAPPPTPRGHDVRVDLDVSLADVFTGATFTVVRDKGVLTPAPGKRKCNCRAHMRTRQIGPGMYQQFTEEVCEECDAVKLVREKTKLAVTLDPGTPPNTEIKFFEEGEPHVDGDPGDLVFVVRPRPHPRFERVGDNLRLNATIPLADALVGFATSITHLDGRKVALAATGVTRPGATMVLAGEGMPRSGGGAGDLLVTFTIDFPGKLSDKQKKAVRDNFKAGVKDEL